MELWAWVAGYLVLFALLHLVLYYVYVRRGEGAPSSPFDADGNPSTSGHPTSPEGASPPAREADRPQVDDEAITCAECGTINEHDPVYTYCHECIGVLE